MVSFSNGYNGNVFDSSLASIAYQGINRGSEPIFNPATRNVFPYLEQYNDVSPVNNLLLSTAPLALSLLAVGGLYTLYSTFKKGFKEGRIMKKMKPFKMPKAFKDLDEFVLPNAYQFPEKYPYLTEQEKKNSETIVKTSKSKKRRNSEKYYYDDSEFEETDGNLNNSTEQGPELSNSRDLSLVVESPRYQSRTSNSHFSEENDTYQDRTESNYDSFRSSGDSSYTRRQSNGMNIDDAFNMFGIDKNTSFEDAKKAYRKCMIKNHPNYNQDDNDKVELTKKLNKAWEVIQKYYNRKV